MNRETRRMIEREERRQKNKESGGRGPAGRPPAQRATGGGTAAGGAQPAAERQSLVRRVTIYLHEVRVEMRKVSWPTRDQMIVFTAVTMMTSLALTALVFVMDFGLKNAVLWVIDRG